MIHLNLSHQLDFPPETQLYKKNILSVLRSVIWHLSLLQNQPNSNCVSNYKKNCPILLLLLQEYDRCLKTGQKFTSFCVNEIYLNCVFALYFNKYASLNMFIFTLYNKNYIWKFVYSTSIISILCVDRPKNLCLLNMLISAMLRRDYSKHDSIM